MEQECHTKMNLSNAMLHTMDSSTPASSSMAIPINQAHHTNTTNNNNTANNNNNNDSTSNDSMCRVISMVQYRQQPVSVGSPMESMFGDKHMRLNSCYVSKITNNGRRIADTSLRMRPYFIPERSRTKSENSVEPEAYVGMSYACSSGASAQNFCAETMNSNSNSMMETCEAYLNADGSGSSGTGHTFNGFTTFNCSQVLPNAHNFLNSNQYFRPIKCASLTHQLKKCKSLESVRAENIDGSQPSHHEMEFVSNRIQKLKVQE